MKIAEEKLEPSLVNILKRGMLQLIKYWKESDDNLHSSF